MQTNVGIIIAIAIAAVVVIIFAYMFGMLPHHVIMGIVFTALSILLFAVAGLIFIYSRLFGAIVGVIAFAFLLYAAHEFSISEPAKQGALLPTITQLLLWL
jgi:hypothetical protein